MYTEKPVLAFSNGKAVVGLKSGYSLVAAYPIGRPSTETDNYAITSIYGRTDGYCLMNKYASLSSAMQVTLVWLKVL